MTHQQWIRPIRFVLRAVARSGSVAVAMAAIVALATLPVWPGPMAAHAATDSDGPRTLIVDGGERQCAKTPYTTISAAVDAARNGDHVRVCPGRYTEQVTVDKSLTIRGEAETVEALDCFAPSRPVTDPTTHAIVALPAGAAAGAAVFELQADNIELEGFVIEGNQSLSSRAIATSTSHSGYHIHHNVMWDHTTAVHFTSNVENPATAGSDVLPSSFHHNCVREVRWGVVN